MKFERRIIQAALGVGVTCGSAATLTTYLFNIEQQHKALEIILGQPANIPPISPAASLFCALLAIAVVLNAFRGTVSAKRLQRIAQDAVLVDKDEWAEAALRLSEMEMALRNSPPDEELESVIQAQRARRAQRAG